MAIKLIFKNIERRLIAIIIFAICTLIFWSWNSSDKSAQSQYIAYLQPKPETIFQDRDMSIYDSGSTIADCFNTGPISHEKIKDCKYAKKQAREFIYKHWQNRKRAYISFITNCDACNEIYVFIEPDEKGDWHIMWKRQYSDFERGFSSNISNEEMSSIKFKTATNIEDDYPFEIGTKYLIFFDKENKVAGIF